jgi:GH25 family lysozyme M1 (1,4-beta-N-acetylmuramidase)
LQSHGYYAVFFLTPEIFDDEEKNREEVKLFFELIILLNYLKVNNYLTIYRNKTEMLYFFQETFTDVKASGKSILLNDKGDYSSSTNTIHDKNKNIIYKGIIFDADIFELILSTTTGVMVLSDKFRDLLVNEYNIDPVQKLLVSNSKRSLLTNIFSFILLSALTYFVYNKTMEYEGHLKRISNKEKTVLNKNYSNTNQKNNIPNRMIVPKPVIDSAQYFYGVDISKWNGDASMQIDPTDNISFIICKATQGTSEIDIDFIKNWKIIREKKCILGAYHFYNTYQDPIKQAQHYWKTIAGEGKTDMIPIVDIEQLSLPKNGRVKPVKLQNDLVKFLNYIEYVSGRIPMIYTAPSFANKYLANTLFSKYPLWVAEYTKAKEIKIPVAWKEKGYKIWQKSNSYFVDSNIYDFDVFYGKKSDLYK